MKYIHQNAVSSWEKRIIKDILTYFKMKQKTVRKEKSIAVATTPAIAI